MSFQTIKVLVILHHSLVGGPLNRTITVAGGLRKEGIEVILTLPKINDKKLINLIKNHNLKFYEINYKFPKYSANPLVHFKWLISLLPTAVQLRRIILHEGITIIHNDGFLNIQGLIVSLLTRKPLIWHLNDISIPRSMARVFGSLLLPLATLIVASSRNVGRYYLGDRNNFIVLYPPVDLLKFNPYQFDELKEIKLKKELGVSGDEVLIGTIGNINPDKGYEYLLLALVLLKKQISNFKVLIVGSKLQSQKRYYDYLQEIIKKNNLYSQVIFTGMREDIKDILGILDVFVMSSVREACPVALLEAMAMQKPIVATAVGGIPEILEDGKTGILVPPRDPKRLANAMSTILCDGRLGMQLGRAARIEIENKFQFFKCLKRYKQAYYISLTRIK